MKLLTALVFTLIALPAGAADFNLTVPVRLNNIHREVAELFVKCYVSRVATAGSTIISAENLIGRAEPVSVAIPSSGDYSGTVRVSFDALPGKNPADAVYYLCYLDTGTGTVRAAVGLKNPRYIPGPGASNNTIADGPIRR